MFPRKNLTNDEKIKVVQKCSLKLRKNAQLEDEWSDYMMIKMLAFVGSLCTASTLEKGNSYDMGKILFIFCLLFLATQCNFKNLRIDDESCTLNNSIKSDFKKLNIEYKRLSFEEKLHALDKKLLELTNSSAPISAAQDSNSTQGESQQRSLGR